MEPETRAGQGGTAIAAVLALIAWLMLAAPASAAAPEFLLQIPEDTVSPAGGAGALNNPRGIVGDPTTGHIYVSEFFNSRISEFTAWGGFVKAWGWDVAPPGAPGDTGANELEVCTTTCKAGISGDGAGQLRRPRGVTRDGAGNLYVYEAEDLASELTARVQKFDPAGNFLLMFGGEVNKTSGADICTKADLEGGDVCGAGLAGSANGWFSDGSVGNFIAYNPMTDTIFVGDEDRIQEFETDGSFKGKIDFDAALFDGQLDGRTVGALAIDPLSGDIYLAPESLPPTVEKVFKLSSSGAEIDDDFAKGDAPYPDALATDIDGNVYVVITPYGDNNAATEDSPGEVVGFDASGNPIAGLGRGEEFATPTVEGFAVGIRGIGTNVAGPGSGEPGDLYVSYFSPLNAHINAYGPSPIAFEPPPSRPPEIGAQYGVAAGTEEAVMRAQINPRFWTDAHFFVQYGTEPCSEGGCKEQPLAPGTLLSAKSINKTLTTTGVLLEGLTPDTTYHFRFVAQSGGGGPVYGIDPDGKSGPKEASLEEGLEGSFRTFAQPDPVELCPANEAFRSGASAKLPDCRAYEMVSPLDKNSADATVIAEGRQELSQSTPSGEKFTFSARRSFGETQSAPYASQYIATREDEGWLTEPISAPRTRLLQRLESLRNEFHAFSTDLCMAWLRRDSEPPLAPGGIPGYPNLYRRDNCSQPREYEPLTWVEPPLSVPPNRVASDFLPVPLGFSEDGSHTIFNANAKLTAQGAALVSGAEDGLGEQQLYEYLKGEPFPRLVCILPSENPSPQPCGAGGPGDLQGLGSNVQGAISADGSRIFWTSYTGAINIFGNPGRIFVRIDGNETVPVSQAVSPEPAWFWGAAKDGSRAIFEIRSGPLINDLYEFDVNTKTTTLIAKGVSGVVGMNEDASMLYFVSGEDLDGGGAAAGGALNLYLRKAEGGGVTFIGALAQSDLLGSDPKPNPVNNLATQRSVRLSADGRFGVFMSAASLTGYDNTDAVSGKADMEVFLYDAEEATLRCISCNPTGVRPTGKSEIAGRIPGWERATHASEVLSSDGQRLFFESYEALVPGDGNGVLDVYQWEAAGKGGCDEADATFSEQSEGCVDLISSGQSPDESRFLEATPSGEDVFLATLSSLVSQDYGLFDAYDARVGGGFPSPVEGGECEGQACSSPPAPPPFLTPPSSSPAPASTKAKPCPKGKRRVVRKGKARCVSRKQGKRKAHKRASRRAAR